MRRDDVLGLLGRRREELRTRFGVASIALFGSVARDEARAGSDVDLLVEFDGAPSWASFNDLIDYLEEALGARVDLATPAKLKPLVRPYVERELIRVA